MRHCEYIKQTALMPKIIFHPIKPSLLLDSFIILKCAPCMVKSTSPFRYCVYIMSDSILLLTVRFVRHAVNSRPLTRLIQAYKSLFYKRMLKPGGVIIPETFFDISSCFSTDFMRFDQFIILSAFDYIVSRNYLLFLDKPVYNVSLV